MIIYKANSFSRVSNTLHIDGQETISKVADLVAHELRMDNKNRLLVLFGGKEVPIEMWDKILISNDDDIRMIVKIKGDDLGSIAGTLVTIMVAVTVTVITQGLGLAPLTSGLIGLAAVTLTQVAISGMFAPNEATSQSTVDETSQMYNITGQANLIKPYENVPKVYGYHKMYPTIAATPYYEFSIDPTTNKLVQDYIAIYDFGLGPCAVSEAELKIGEDNIVTYSPTMAFVDLNRPLVNGGSWDLYTSRSFNLYRGAATTESFSLGLQGDLNPSGYITPSRYNVSGSVTTITKTAPTPIALIGTVQKFQIQGVFNQGLIAYASDNTTRGVRVFFRLYYTYAGLPGYQQVYSTTPLVSLLGLNWANSELMYVESTTTAPVYTIINIELNTLFDVTFRLVRVVTEVARTEDDIAIANKIPLAAVTFPKHFADYFLTNITNRTNTPPIVTDFRHKYLEIKLRASEKINGTIQNLSSIVYSVLPMYNGLVWAQGITNNPAWIIVDLLTNESVNPKAVSLSRIDTTSFLAFAKYCDEIPAGFTAKRHTVNFILDFSTTALQLINNITSMCNAGLSMIGGKYGIIIDQRKYTPVQIFTERNSSNFSCTRTYFTPPHALKVKYIDPNTGWQTFDVTVYNDGYCFTNATVFEKVNTFGITEYEQAWRYGRILQAQSKLRQEVISIEVDFEHLVCNVGDYVLFTHDVMKVGGKPSRVVSMVGSTVTIDEEIIFNPLLTYGYTFRSASGIFVGTFTPTGTFTATLTPQVPGQYPGVGDLFIYGESSTVTYECIIKSIRSSGDLKATLELIERADAIHDSIFGVTLPDYNPYVSIVQSQVEYIPPAVLDLTEDKNTWRCNVSNYEYYINLSWGIEVGSLYNQFEIYVNGDLGDYTSNLNYEFIVPNRLLGSSIEFTVVAVTASGSKLPLNSASKISVTPLPKTTRPSDVDALYLNVTGEVLQLEWPLVGDCDIDRYLIRYSPQLNAIWETSVPLMYSARNINMVSTQARTGTYLIKAIDWAGNVSSQAATAITSIPSLFNLNLIEELNDFPTLTGAKEDVVNSGGVIRLRQTVAGGPGVAQYATSGQYLFSELLDTGDIYTSRLQSYIQAEGYNDTDIMSNWILLSDVTAMTTILVSDWDVEFFVRTRDSYDTISDWNLLSDIIYIYQGSEDDWTPYRKFTVGDFTGRIFQFKLKLSSFRLSVTPSVINAFVRVDMPDRVDSYNNIICPNTGLNFSYPTAFAGPNPSPNIQITQDDAQTGDYYVLSNKSLNGFTIHFYNSSNTLVERQFDAMVRGYGRKAVTSI